LEALLFIILHFIISFRVRSIINEAWGKKGITRKVSWFFTLIFNVFYLQYEINRTVNDKENEKRIGPWVFFLILILLPIISVLLIWNSVANNLEVGIASIEQQSAALNNFE